MSTSSAVFEANRTLSWTFAGCLNSGESVFFTPAGDLAIEKDHAYLIEVTPEERAEIYQKWPHLNPISKMSLSG